MDETAPEKSREEAAPEWELRALTDDELFARLEVLAAQERECVVEVVRHLKEVDNRDIVQDRGYTTLFEYCLKKLHYSESSTFLRIRAARAAAHFPRVIDDLRSGALHLDGIMRLYPHLNSENCDRVLDAARGAPKREIMALAASLGPTERAIERDSIRFIPPAAPRKQDSTPSLPIEALRDSSSIESSSVESLFSPTPTPTGSTPAPAAIPHAAIIPAPRVRLAFSADASILALVDRIRAMRRHKYPSGDFEDLFRDALEALIAVIELPMKEPSRRKTRKRQASRKGRGSRFIPRSIRRAVWKRDGGRCAFTSPDGRRCEATEFLEYDHVVPWALGGRSDTTENVRLLCRPHNQRLARRRFGPRPK